MFIFQLIWIRTCPRQPVKRWSNHQKISRHCVNSLIVNYKNIFELRFLVSLLLNLNNFLVFIVQDDIRHGGMFHTFVQNVSSYSASIQVTPDESSDPESPTANKVCNFNLLD